MWVCICLKKYQGWPKIVWERHALHWWDISSHIRPCSRSNLGLWKLLFGFHQTVHHWHSWRHSCTKTYQYNWATVHTAMLLVYKTYHSECNSVWFTRERKTSVCKYVFTVMHLRDESKCHRRHRLSFYKTQNIPERWNVWFLRNVQI